MNFLCNNWGALAWESWVKFSVRFSLRQARYSLLLSPFSTLLLGGHSEPVSVSICTRLFLLLKWKWGGAPRREKKNYTKKSQFFCLSDYDALPKKITIYENYIRNDFLMWLTEWYNFRWFQEYYKIWLLMCPRVILWRLPWWLNEIGHRCCHEADVLIISVDWKLYPRLGWKCDKRGKYSACSR